MARIDARSLGRGDATIPTTGGQLTSGFVLTGVDSTTFTPMYVASSRKFYRDCLVVRYLVSTPSTGSAETRLHLPDQNVTSDELFIPADTTAVVVWRWEHGQSSDEVGGESMRLEIQTRRFSGSGTISTFNPEYVVFAPSTVIDDSDSGGNPVIE